MNRKVFRARLWSFLPIRLALGQLAGLLHFPIAVGTARGNPFRYFGIGISLASMRALLATISSITSLFSSSLHLSLFVLFFQQVAPPVGLCFLFDYDIRSDSRSVMELFPVWKMFLMGGYGARRWKKLPNVTLNGENAVLSIRRMSQGTCHYPHLRIRSLRNAWTLNPRVS